MGLKDKILGFLGWGLGSSLPRGHSRYSPPTKGGPKVPPWARQDYYAQKELGQAPSGEEPAADFAPREGSADFLRPKLDGGTRVQQFEKTKKSTGAGKRALGMKDGEIKEFLGGVLEKRPKK